MKCGVCGNELKPDAKKCGICGTSCDSVASLDRAMSNISSLANALKARREVRNNTKAFETELKKVASRQEDLENLYYKDIEIKTEEDEYEEDFDLNAFYQQAEAGNTKNSKDPSTSVDEVEDGIEDGSDDEDSLDSEEVTDNNEIDNYQEQSTDDDFVEQGEDDQEVSEDFEVEDNDDKDTSLDIDFDEDDNADESTSYGTADMIKPSKEYGEPNDSSEDLIIPTVEEPDIEDESEEIQISDPSSSEKNLDSADVLTKGYIKESDIEFYQEQEVEEEEVIDRFPPVAIEQPEVESAESSQETQQEDEDESIEISIEEDPSEEVNIKDDESSSEETFDPVKPEEVPYTQLEESKGSKVDDNHPIVLDDAQVVSAQPSTTPNSHTKEKSKEDKKPNKFFAIMAKILITLAVLAFAVLSAHKYLLQDMDSNAVVDFINNFFTTGSNMMYFVLGTLGVCIVAILFSLLQLIFVKRRKIGAITLLISFVVTGALVGGYYFYDLLVPAIDFLMALFG